MVGEDGAVTLGIAPAVIGNASIRLGLTFAAAMMLYTCSVQ